MKPTHKIQITFDEATGQVVASHRCTVDVAGKSISHSQPVEMPDDVAVAMKAFIDQNRESVEAVAINAAVTHAAAVAKQTKAGVKHLSVGGGISLTSSTTEQKG